MILDRLAGWWMDWRMGLNAGRVPELRLERMEVRNEIGEGTVGVIASHPLIWRFASELAELLNMTPGADNYVQVDMMPRPDHGVEPIRVTVQWAKGLSPGQLNLVLKQENAWMRRVFLAMSWTYWMKWVEGPWYATGDMAELAFFRQLREERIKIIQQRDDDPPSE